MKTILKVLMIPTIIIALGLSYTWYKKQTSQQSSNQNQELSAAGTSQSILESQCQFCPEMVVLQGSDNFLMGNDEPEQKEDDDILGIVRSNQLPRHNVKIKKFAIGRTEVTQAQWQSLMGNNPVPTVDVCSECPVAYINKHDIQEYIKRLNAKTSKTYRLPSEAEWEYAAMGDFAPDSYFYKDEQWADEHVWQRLNSGITLNPVATKKPNKFGVYDLLGSVWEWVEDCYHSNYQNAPTTSDPWLDNTGKESLLCERDIYIVRGGSVIELVISPRHRGSVKPDRTGPDLGFRLAMTLD